MSYHRLQTEAWLKTIEVKADRVLDIGGSQLPIKGRTKSWEVVDYKILDLDKPHECKQPPDIVADIEDERIENGIQMWQVEKENYRKYQTEYEGYMNYFNTIFCIEVSEYWSNPTMAIFNLMLLLKHGGILYITFPFIYMAHKPEGTDFLRYTPAGAEKLLIDAGFEILEHKYRTATSDKLLPFWEEEGMKGLPGADHNIIGSMIKCKKL